MQKREGSVSASPTSVLTVSGVARECGVTPVLISSLFWRRLLDEEACPVLSGRRVIPRSYVPGIGKVLVEMGHLTPGGEPTGRRGRRETATVG
jgi:hypothetical protein